MKVGELVKKLQNLDQEATVCYMDEEGNTVHIDNIEQFNKIVELSSK